jgi:hypothetical protein
MISQHEGVRCKLVGVCLDRLPIGGKNLGIRKYGGRPLRGRRSTWRVGPTKKKKKKNLTLNFPAFLLQCVCRFL